MRINQGEQLQRETDYAIQDFSPGKQILKTSGCKNLWGLQQREKRPASQEFLGETHSVLEFTQIHPP